MRPFRPLVANPHLLTILGNFWPRTFDFSPYPMHAELYRTEPGVQVLVQTQRPLGPVRGEIVMVHGLEGAGDAGYVRTLAYAALQAGFVAHRFHMRTCGGTESFCQTLYHAGLTSDLREFLRLSREGPIDQPPRPVFLVGYSLGGNVVLKLAGELGEAASEWLAGVCAISVPIDLAACAHALELPGNRLYQSRFVKRMKKRLLATGRYSPAQLAPLSSIWDIDDAITAPSFGFRGASHYYATQSSKNFLSRIRIPALVIQAQDDPLVPFPIFHHPAFRENPHLRLLAPTHGGHLGFLSRQRPRFWCDGVVIDWAAAIAARISDHAQVSDPAQVFDNAQASDHAPASDHARASDA